MKTKVFWSFLIIIFLGIVVWEGVPTKFGNWVKSGGSFSDLFSQLKSNESLPGPLFGPLSDGPAQLTTTGVVLETNKQREQFGNAPLHVNNKLNLAAQAKLNDLFRRQYFEHESPDGKGPADLAKAAGYDFLVVGENLALGNFINDQVLVEAWMNSPGHRANILDKKYEEIGVAVGKGEYEGKQVWIAVQEFGTPLSKCPSPSGSLKNQINSNQLKIDKDQIDLQKIQSQLEQTSKRDRQAYNVLVEQYNSLAQKLNTLIDQTKQLVNQYNDQVNEFNKCLENNA